MNLSCVLSKLKVPPPAVALITGLLMWLVSRATPALAFMFPARSVFAIALAAAGAATAITGALTFRRAHTTVNPTKPESASSLVNWGVFSRNSQPNVSGTSSGPDRLGNFLVEPARVPFSPRLCPLYKPLPNRARGTRPRLPLRKRLRAYRPAYAAGYKIALGCYAVTKCLPGSPFRCAGSL